MTVVNNLIEPDLGGWRRQVDLAQQLTPTRQSAKRLEAIRTGCIAALNLARVPRPMQPFLPRFEADATINSLATHAHHRGSDLLGLRLEIYRAFKIRDWSSVKLLSQKAISLPSCSIEERGHLEMIRADAYTQSLLQDHGHTNIADRVLAASSAYKSFTAIPFAHYFRNILVTLKLDERCSQLLELTAVVSPSSEADLVELRGDILLAHGKSEQALQYIQAAGEAPSERTIYSNIAGSRKIILTNTFARTLGEHPSKPRLVQELHDLTHHHQKLFASGAHNNLAKIYHKRGNYSRAFQHLKRSKTLQSEQTKDLGRIIIARAKEEVVQIQNILNGREYFDEVAACRPTLKPIDTCPIYVSSLPRSGGTLLLHALTSHTDKRGRYDILPGGERIELAAAMRTVREMEVSSFCMAFLADEFRSGCNLAYQLRLAAEASNTYRWIVDKACTNFMHFGLIDLVYPEAPIIHIERHPLDTFMAVHRKHLAEGSFWSFNTSLRMIQQYYHETYLPMMQHWKGILRPSKLFPEGRVLTVRYEDLASPEKHAKTVAKVLDYCRLSHTELCFKSYLSGVPALTDYGVHLPIYNSSIGGWKNYTKELSRELEPRRDASYYDLLW